MGEQEEKEEEEEEEEERALYNISCVTGVCMHALLPSFSLARERHEPKFLIGRDRFVSRFFPFFFLSLID